jgi:hypothetical protein
MGQKKHHGMRRETHSNNNHRGVLHISHVIKQIIRVEGDIEGRTTIGQLLGKADRLRPPLVVV